MEIVVFLAFVLCVVILGWAVCELLVKPFLPPWGGYNQAAVSALVKKFVPRGADIKFIFGPIPGKRSFMFPTAGMYEANSAGSTIYVDTRYVRSEGQLVEVLLHELCHFNQHTQGRFNAGLRGMYFFQPVEREARSFAAVWHGVAKRIYRFELRKQKTRIL